MKRIGWIGTGVMGRAMCARLLKEGCQVAVFNRTREKAAELEQSGAVFCESPQQVAARSDVVFTMVGYPTDVEDVILGRNGVLAGAREGSVIVEMTTSEPALAQRIHAEALLKGVAALDAPVSGGDIGAREGTLAIMVGGDAKTFEAVLPLLQILGGKIAYMGPAGSGQHTKVCNQTLIASTMIGVVESLLYACKSGLHPDAVIDIIGSGAAACWSINNLGRRIVKGDFDPGFFIKHFVKDMGIALSEARRMKLALPGLALAHQFYIAAMAGGLEDLGTQGLYKVYERINGGS